MSDLRVTNNWQVLSKIRLALKNAASHSELVMSNETETETATAPATVTRRRPGLREKAFIVQCVNYRCMAYRDSSGKWRDYFNGEEIQGEVLIIAEG